MLKYRLYLIPPKDPDTTAQNITGIVAETCAIIAVSPRTFPWV